MSWVTGIVSHGTTKHCDPPKSDGVKRSYLYEDNMNVKTGERMEEEHEIKVINFNMNAG